MGSPIAGFQDQCLKPLGHASWKEGRIVFGRGSRWPLCRRHARAPHLLLRHRGESRMQFGARKHMTTRHDHKTALREALALAVVLLSLMAAVLIMQQRPAGHDELKISIDTLRSQAAELVALLAQHDDQVTPLSPTDARLGTAPA